MLNPGWVVRATLLSHLTRNGLTWDVQTSQSITKLLPRRIEIPAEWVVSCDCAPMKEILQWMSLTSRGLRKKATHEQALHSTRADPVTGSFVQTNVLKELGMYLFAGKIEKVKFNKTLHSRLNHETAPGFCWGPGVSGTQAEKQSSSLQLGLLEFWR